MTSQQPFHVVPKQTLTQAEITAIAALETRCNEAEGIEIATYIEWYADRPVKGQTDDFLCYRGDELIGYLNLFYITEAEVEINGMVAPEHRRRGVFRHLLTVADKEIAARNFGTRLLVIASGSRSGTAFAEKIGAALRNTEYSMKLTGFQPAANKTEGLALHRATPADFEFLVTCSSRAFADDEANTRELLERTNESNRTTWKATVNGTPVGMIRAFFLEDKETWFHGFAVLPEHQGLGYGRQILSQAVQLMLDQGRTNLFLRVDTDNENALNLYKSCGFEVTTATHYYRR